MILQKSFKDADLLLKKNFLLSVLNSHASLYICDIYDDNVSFFFFFLKNGKKEFTLLFSKDAFI